MEKIPENGATTATNTGAAQPPNGKMQVKFESTMSLPETISYFDAIIAGLKKKSLHLRQGDQVLALTPSPHVDIAIKAVRDKKNEAIRVEIAWRLPAREPSISST
jgi:amphi-Trp domain-containing protein